VRDRTTVWDSASWLWRLASIVGLVTEVGVVWHLSFANFLEPRVDNHDAAVAGANIVLMWTAPLALLFWVELVWRARFAWLWIAVWTAPVHTIPVLFLACGQSTGAFWLFGPLHDDPLEPWLGALVWANMGLQLYVGVRAIQLGRGLRSRVPDASVSPDEGAGTRSRTGSVRQIAEVVSVVFLRLLAALALYCIWFPADIMHELVRACGVTLYPSH
jgi:hypothetical protein